MSDHLELGTRVSREPEGGFSVEDLAMRVDRALASTQEDGRCAIHAWPVPRVPSERLLAAAAHGDAVFWAPPGEDEICALGAAFVLTASGPDRFASIERQASEVWPQLADTPAERGLPGPRFLGGFAFQPGHSETAPWCGFGDARFVLPRIAYLRTSEGAFLRVIARASEARSATLREQVQRALAALFTPPAPPSPESTRVLGKSERPQRAWTELLAAIQEEIACGRAQKIVAARRVSLDLNHTLDPALLQSRLREHAPESTRFAFRVAESTFLGATPERLVQKRGSELVTEAVAGSINADDATSATRLLESSKDSREHELVVSEILRLLGPMTSELAPGKREIHRLRTVLHLRTPILGQLREPKHVLELVAKLHPTPAVGGVPTRAAIDFIEQHEPDERGWYAGPVGWFDAQGDGRFVVALRSGVIEGKHAELYAGAGIVRDSHAPSEFAETRWKLAALLGALGVAE